MLTESEISIYDFASALSGAVDLISPSLNGHHKRVAYIAGKIALEMNVSVEDTQDIILASMLHDIGAFSPIERIRSEDPDAQENELEQHTMQGYKLLKGFEPLARAASLIRYHHADFFRAGSNVPLGSYIISIADKAAVLVDDKREILEQVPEVYEKITFKYHQFDPRTMSAFFQLAKYEYFMVEAFSPAYSTIALKKMHYPKKIIDMDALRDFAKVIAQIIDFRSRFTSTHSSGVAAVALELATISGFSERECRLMEIAGLLHDLGKLAVSNDILEKNGKLDSKEINFIKKHTYYTYAVLNKISGLEHIATLAAYHHERPDGNGYPFHMKNSHFSKLARIMAVADIITALTEDRPYRSGMSREQAGAVLQSMASSGGIDRDIMELATKNFSRINEVRHIAQMEAKKEYEAFHSSGIRQ